MKYFRFLLILFAIFILAIIAVMYFAARQPVSEPAIAPEEHDALYESPENGYHVLAESFPAIALPDKQTKNELSDLREKPDRSETSAQYIEKHRPVIEDMTAALDNPYIILPRIEATSIENLIAAQKEHSDEVMRIHLMSKLFIWDGKAFEQDGKLNLASERYIDALQLGQSITKGGLLTDTLTASGITHETFLAFDPLLDDLGADELEFVINQLIDLGQRATPFNDIMANDYAFHDQALQGRLYRRVLTRFMNNLKSNSNRKRLKMTERIEIRYHATQSMLIGLRLRAQVNLYALQGESQPTTLSEVVAPDPVPIDPTTGNPFELLPNGTITSQGQRPDGIEQEFF